jgi:hypothetical protein
MAWSPPSWAAQTPRVSCWTTGSDVPATEDGIDPGGGAQADAVTDGGAAPAGGPEPDLRDAAAGPRQADIESASDDDG